MTINISDVIINIGKQTNSIDWFDFCKTVLSVLLGGLITYWASKKLKANDSKQETIQKFTLISQIAGFCFNAIYTYKENVILPIRKNIDRNEINLSSTLSFIYLPRDEFNVNLKDYIFLGGFNSYFPDLLNKTDNIYQLFKQTIDSYNEFVKNDLNSKFVFKEQYTFDQNTYIRTFETLEHITNELLIRLYFVLKNCNVCYDKYFNVSCIDNIKENFDNLKLEEAPIIKEIIENGKYKEIQNYQIVFEKCWIGQSRLGCTICYMLRRIKHWFKWLKIYLLLPENCKFLKKKNKEEKQTSES